MAEQNPYEPGAVWVARDTNKRVRIMNVFTDEKGLVPGLHAEVYVVVTPSGREEILPQVHPLEGFLHWHERPEGGQPRPFIPRQQTGSPS